MISKLSVKRQWFQTAVARRMFPTLVGSAGAVLEDKDTGKTVRVRVSGRAVTIEETRAAAIGAFCAADVDERFRTKVARRVSMSHELASDVFDPSCAHVPAECVLGEEHSYDSSCVAYLESGNAEEDDQEDERRVDERRREEERRADERRREGERVREEDRRREEGDERRREAERMREEEDERRREEARMKEEQRDHKGREDERREDERREEERKKEREDARVLEVVTQLFDKALLVSRHVPVIRLPLASVTFQYLCETQPPRAVLERLGERYLETLQSALQQSEAARRTYAARCVGAGGDLRQQILDGTWE
jgi:hypothetical protein